MKTHLNFLGIFVAFLLCLPTISAAEDSTAVRHISGLVPVQGNSRENSAERPAQSPHIVRTDSVSPKANPWKLQATLPGAVVHDISFPTAKVGYAAAELGQVWKTTDGGTNWSEILNVGFPYYWYGVHALSATDVVISGFNDSAGTGVIRWSRDGGKIWTKDIILTTTGWAFRVRFANVKDGLVLDGADFKSANGAHYTKNGGALAADWKSDVPDPSGGWFGNEFSLLTNLHARASGIQYCTSLNDGAKWSCRPSIDSVFDGPAFFLNDQAGWVGGGEISPNVEGWVHRTTDGGKTWSGRTLDDPWPIREILFLKANFGWAAGGNYSQNVGGMYFSRDGGKTWSLDVNTGAEMGACDSKPVGSRFQIWCAGYDGSLNSVVYTLNTGASLR